VGVTKGEGQFVTIEAAEAVPPAKSSDLKTRTISGVVMMAAALALLWFGGIPFLIALLVLGGLVFYEFSSLVDGFAKTTIGRLCWKMFGLVYVSVAIWSLWQLRKPDGIEGFTSAIFVLSTVWAVDIGAYFTGRTIGGRKIWPAISPSKTWSGLFGGMAGATLVLIVAAVQLEQVTLNAPILVIFALMGAIVAIVAQSGDFFESWMKRKAGVKDSGALIPGHGGIFDRVDGLLPVVIIANLIVITARGFLGE
jgi:phosphatidate cytidylyltransferase